MISQEVQEELIDLIERYNKTDPQKIKKNIHRLIYNSKYKTDSKSLADLLNVDIQTIYLYRQAKKRTKINFLNALRISKAFNISIEDLIK
jgi:hypothetical protein